MRPEHSEETADIKNNNCLFLNVIRRLNGRYRWAASLSLITAIQDQRISPEITIDCSSCFSFRLLFYLLLKCVMFALKRLTSQSVKKKERKAEATIYITVCVCVCLSLCASLSGLYMSANVTHHHVITTFLCIALSQWFLSTRCLASNGSCAL